MDEFCEREKLRIPIGEDLLLEGLGGAPGLEDEFNGLGVSNSGLGDGEEFCLSSVKCQSAG